MNEFPTEELVALYLADAEEGETRGEGKVPHGLSTPGFVDALGMGDTLSARIELLSTITSMREADLLEEHRAHVAGLDGERNVYRLTEAGRRLAGDVRGRLDGEHVTLDHDGDVIEVALADLEDYRPDLTVAEALARLDDDGVLRLPGDRPAEEFVDRETECEILREHLAAVEGGAARTVLVGGESGIGKTALLEHVLGDAEDRGVEVLTGDGRDGTAQPYRPFRDALAAHRSSMPARLFEPEDGVDDVGHLQDLDDRRLSLFYEIGEALGELAAARPRSVVVDDLHATDRGTLALFEYLAVALEDVPVLLVGAYRPEELTPEHPLTSILDDGLAATADARLSLAPLDEAATGALVERTLGDHSVPRAFVETIHERTGGHPLFVEASLTNMRDQRAIDPHTGHYPDRPDIPVPDRVQTTIERRLDSLDDAARTVLELGAAVGGRIPFRVLAAVSDRSEPDLREHVDLLVGAHIWRRVPEDDAVTFANEIGRDVVLERLDEAERRALHQRVAAALRELREGALDVHAWTIAHHYDLAGNVDQAIHFYERAGTHAAGLYAHETAVDAFERALVLAREHDRDERVLSLLAEIGIVHFNAGSYDEADRAFGYVRDRTDDRETVWDVTAYLARIRMDRGEFDAAIDLADHALADWDGETESAGVCHLLLRKAFALFRTGKLAETRAVIDDQLAMADALDDDRLRAKGFNRLGGVEYARSDLDEAERAFRTAADIGRERGMDTTVTRGQSNLGMVHMLRGDLDEALETFERSREYAREMGKTIRELSPLLNVGYCRWKLGDLEEARALLEECVETCRTLDRRPILAYALVNIGQIHLESGDLASARQYLEEARDVGRETGIRKILSRALFGLASLERLKDDLDDALALVDESLETIGDLDVEISSEAYARRGTIYRTMDRTDEAIAAYEAGLETAEACGNPEKRARNRYGLATAYLRPGRGDQALAHAEAAIEIAHGSDYPVLVAEARLACGRVQRFRGDHEAAAEALTAALSVAREFGVAVIECKVLYERGRLHRAMGTPETVRDALENALALAEEMGATLYERRCRSELESLSADAT